MASHRLNQYEIVRSLGAGAHGTAYRAVDTRLGRAVVLKLLRQDAAASMDLRDRLLEEARLASALEHPNVCTIYEVGEADGVPFIAMQYAPGRTLSEILAAGPLPLDFALSVGIQAASGLAAAHDIGILHRDLKPDNLMVAEDGSVKILDFGLARRKRPELAGIDSSATPSGSGEASTYFGTTAYMAPEQFELRRSSEQSDIFSLGVILYQTVTGRHPFLPPGTDPTLVPAAIRTQRPPSPRVARPEVPEALEGIILKALAKQPASRFRHASDLADALKGVMRSLELETGIVPGEISAVLPAPPPGAPARGRRWAGLVERLLPTRAPEVPPNSIGVLPFHDLDSRGRSRQDGFVLSAAVETRLARIPNLVVRTLSAWLSLSERPLDPVAVGREMQVEQVLRASFRRRGNGLVLHWQLLEVDSRAVRTGGTITLPARDLSLVQDDVAEEIVSSLGAEGHLGSPRPPARPTDLEDLSEPVREAYLDARARLARFAIHSGSAEELREVRDDYQGLLELAPTFAPVHAGLGTVYLRSARNGFGGVDDLRAAERHLTRALELDPDLVEAKLYRASTLIWEGEKDRARLDLQQLLRTTPADADVHLAAGVILQLDGLLEEALRLQGEALRLNPIVAPRAYYYRARTLTFLGRTEQARQEIAKGLRLEPHHTLLRHLLGFLQFLAGDIASSITTLEGVLADDPNLRIVAPTLAMACVHAGREADSLISDETLDAAAADAETAYRVASYWAVRGDADEALAWLRRAVFLGNENHPWFAANPVWAPLRDHPEFREILNDLRDVHRLNRLRWERLLKEV